MFVKSIKIFKTPKSKKKFKEPVAKNLPSWSKSGQNRLSFFKIKSAKGAKSEKKMIETKTFNGVNFRPKLVAGKTINPPTKNPITATK